MTLSEFALIFLAGIHVFGVLSLVLEKLFQLLICGCEAALGACFASCIILPGMDATVVKK